MRMTFYSVVLISIFIWGLHASVTELPDIQNPHLILVDENQLYIAESDSISIYSLKGLNKIKTFGRMGEGPGELKGMITAIDIRTKNILVNSVVHPILLSTASCMWIPKMVSSGYSIIQAKNRIPLTRF